MKRFCLRFMSEDGLDKIKKCYKVAKAMILKAKFHKVDYSKIVLLDTSMGSDNAGDQIIMKHCTDVCKSVFPDSQFINIPTHIYDPQCEYVGKYFKILCGTNLIYTHMEKSVQWALPEKIENYSNICLLGVGMQDLYSELPMGKYTNYLLNVLLSSKVYHSVRDEYTKIRLNEIGITNVINTGCPTMWGITPELCARIPVKKGKNVLTTITDYNRDPRLDEYLLRELKRYYENVYIWIQGRYDLQCIKEIVDVNDYIIIPGDLELLDHVLQMKDLDYVGTRLHAGIRSINSEHRSIIISVDNRARKIAKDTNLPILERKDLEKQLEERVFDNFQTDIKIPSENIMRWKNQFKSMH